MHAYLCFSVLLLNFKDLLVPSCYIWIKKAASRDKEHKWNEVFCKWKPHKHANTTIDYIMCDIKVK